MKKDILKKIPSAAAGALMISALGGMLLSGCSADSLSGGGTGGGSGSGKAYEGTWHEQNDPGGTVEISGSDLSYTSPYNNTFSTTFKTKTSGSEIEIVPDEENWYFCDIFYDPATDVLTLHDMPHTDGDGGYHLITFSRKEYVAPPPPVYGDTVDNTDPDAPKSFENDTIQDLTFSVYETSVDSGDMAQPVPYAGDYTYHVTVGEDGNAVISSNFCQDVPFPAEKQEELMAFFKENDFASLNGIDVITEKMPEWTRRYDLKITFADGSMFYSRANGPNIPGLWTEPYDWMEDKGRRFHAILFNAFVDAGYNPSTQEFHSTRPIKRLGSSDETEPAYKIGYTTERIAVEGKAYAYKIHSDYPVFTCENASAPLKKALDTLSARYKEQAESDVKENDELMAAVPESTWKQYERWYMYSFYVPEYDTKYDSFFYMFVSEGHASSMGLGEYGSGWYPNVHYNFDTETGKEMTVSDLFADSEKALAAITAVLCEDYREGSEVRAYYESKDYQEMLMLGITNPASKGGIGFSASYDSVTLYFPAELTYSMNYAGNERLYYERVQDILNDRYVTVY